MNKKTNSGLKIICLNRKASFNYFFEDHLEAGIVLKGSEIKSIRDGKVNIADSYAVEKNGELVLINSHIAAYKQASYSNHNPLDYDLNNSPVCMQLYVNLSKLIHHFFLPHMSPQYLLSHL